MIKSKSPGHLPLDGYFITSLDTLKTKITLNLCYRSHNN